ncbi:hypothetical protein G9A89_000220 [Geosiphon pyriformis]|nr:hypothetical protein G9A89_000220 [Geosiphon pyriformis]
MVLGDHQRGTLKRLGPIYDVGGVVGIWILLPLVAAYPTMTNWMLGVLRVYLVMGPCGPSMVGVGLPPPKNDSNPVYKSLYEDRVFGTVGHTTNQEDVAVRGAPIPITGGLALSKTLAREHTHGAKGIRGLPTRNEDLKGSQKDPQNLPPIKHYQFNFPHHLTKPYYTKTQSDLYYKLGSPYHKGYQLEDYGLLSNKQYLYWDPLYSQGKIVPFVTIYNGNKTCVLSTHMGPRQNQRGTCKVNTRTCTLIGGIHHHLVSTNYSISRSLWQKLYSYAILLVWSPLTPFCTSQVFLHPITTHDLALTYEDNFRTDLVTMDDGTRVLLIQDFFEGPSYLIYNLHTQYTYLSIGNTTYAQRPQ